MKYSYSPKYPLEISTKIYINKIIGQVISAKPVKWLGQKYPLNPGWMFKGRFFLK